MRKEVDKKSNMLKKSSDRPRAFALDAG